MERMRASEWSGAHPAARASGHAARALVDRRSSATAQRALTQAALASPRMAAQRIVTVPGQKGKKGATRDEVIEWLAKQLAKDGKVVEKLKPLLANWQPLEDLLIDKHDSVSVEGMDPWEFLSQIGIPSRQFILDPDSRKKGGEGSSGLKEKPAKKLASKDEDEKETFVSRGKKEKKDPVREPRAPSSRRDEPKEVAPLSPPKASLGKTEDVSETTAEKPLTVPDSPSREEACLIAETAIKRLQGFMVSCEDFRRMQFISLEALKGGLPEQRECHELCVKADDLIGKLRAMLNELGETPKPMALRKLAIRGQAYAGECGEYVKTVVALKKRAASSHPRQNERLACLRRLAGYGLFHSPLFLPACELVQQQAQELSPIKKAVGEVLGRGLLQEAHPDLVILPDVYAIQMVEAGPSVTTEREKDSHVKQNRLVANDKEGRVGVLQTDFDGLACRKVKDKLAVVTSLEAKGGQEDPTKQVEGKQIPALKNILANPHEFCFAEIHDGKFVNINDRFDLKASEVRVLTAGPAKHFDIDMTAKLGIDYAEFELLLQYVAFNPDSVRLA